MHKYLFYIDVFKNQGGAQRVMGNIIQYLMSKNNEVILVVDYDDSNQFYDTKLKERVIIEYLTNNNRGGIITKNIRKLSGLRKIILRESPDICVSFLGLPNIRLLISTIGINVPRVVSVRSDPNVEYGKTSIMKFFVNALFARAEGIVIQTEFVKTYFNTTIQKKCKVIYNPVNDSFYDLRRDDEQNNIVTFGSLVECKNQKLIIDAYASVIDCFPHDDLYIYGEGKLRKELEKQIFNLGLQGRIHLPGNVKNVESILCKSKMFVLSSNYEGMPNALMEAMATGTPCISTDCPSGGPRTLITCAKEGILIPCNDIQILASSMLRLNEEKLRNEMSVCERTRATYFKGEIVLEKWEGYLNTIIESEIQNGKVW